MCWVSWHEIKPLYELRKKFGHLEERYVLADASSRAGPELQIMLECISQGSFGKHHLQPGSAVLRWQAAPCQLANDLVGTRVRLSPKCSHRHELPRR